MPDKKKKRSISELLRSSQAKKFLKSDLDLDMLGSGKSERLDNAAPTQLDASTSDLAELAGEVASSDVLEVPAPKLRDSSAPNSLSQSPSEKNKSIEDNPRTASPKEFEDNSRTSIQGQIEDNSRTSKLGQLKDNTRPISRTDIEDKPRTHAEKGDAPLSRTYLGQSNIREAASVHEHTPSESPKANQREDCTNDEAKNSRTILGHTGEAFDLSEEKGILTPSKSVDRKEGVPSISNAEPSPEVRRGSEEPPTTVLKIDQFQDNSRTSPPENHEPLPRTNIGHLTRTSGSVSNSHSKTPFRGQFEDTSRTGLDDFSETDSRTQILGPFEDKHRTSQVPRPAKRVTSNLHESGGGRSPGLNVGEEAVQSSWMLSAIVGHQRKVLLYVFHSSKENRSRESGPISTEALSNACNAPVLSIRKIVQRMEHRGILQRVAYKSGRGGWTRYLIPEHLYSELLQWELVTKSLDTRVPAASEEAPKVTLPNQEKSLSIEEEEEWNNLDLEPVRAIGFTATHILQLRRKTALTPAQIQDSIHAFAFDIYKNKKLPSLQRPVAYFMGALLKGPYVFPENYESPAILALRKYRERKQREVDLIHAEQNEIRKLEFDSWKAKLSTEDVNRLAPLGTTERTRVAQLQTYFNENVWPGISASFSEPAGGILGPFEDNSRTNPGQSEDDSRTN